MRARLFASFGGLLVVLVGFGVAMAADKPEPKQVPLTTDQATSLQALNAKAQLLQKERADFERATAAEGKVLQLEYERFLDQQCRAAGGDTCAIRTSDERGQALPADKWLLVVTKKPEPPKK